MRTSPQCERWWRQVANIFAQSLFIPYALSFWELIEILSNAAIYNLYKLSNRETESFRFEDRNDYEYKIWFKVFSRIVKKWISRKASLHFFSPEKLALLSLLEVDRALSGLKNAETSNIWLLIPANTTL